MYLSDDKPKHSDTVVATDKDGNMTSINVFGGGNEKGNDAGEFIDVTNDGGYIIFSDTDSKGLKGPNNFGFLYIKNP